MSGSGQIGIILPDPDPCPFQPIGKRNSTFSRKFQNNVQNIENHDTYDADIKVTSTAVNKSPKKSDFPACLKLGVGSGS